MRDCPATPSRALGAGKWDELPSTGEGSGSGGDVGAQLPGAPTPAGVRPFGNKPCVPGQDEYPIRLGDTSPSERAELRPFSQDWEAAGKGLAGGQAWGGMPGASQPPASALPAPDGVGMEGAGIAPAAGTSRSPGSDSGSTDPAGFAPGLLQGSLVSWCSLLLLVVVRERLFCPERCRAPVSIRQGPKAGPPESWDRAVGAQHLESTWD